MRPALLVLIVALLVPTPHAAAQAVADPAGDLARYNVGYVEIAPASRRSFVAALERYRGGSQMEPGFGSLEVFEQTGRPGHFVIVETWKDQPSVDAHARSASVTAFREALQPIRVSGFDERPYKTLSVATRQSAPRRGAVHVVTHVDVGNPGDAATLLRRVAEASRSEPGCVRFDVLQHTMRANHFTVIETWASPRDHEAHVLAPHTKQYRNDLQPLTGSPLDERNFGEVEK
jgi:quinol monooxygenase YgiN